MGNTRMFQDFDSIQYHGNERRWLNRVRYPERTKIDQEDTVYNCRCNPCRD